MADELKDQLTLTEAAALLRMPPRSLRDLCKTKKISFTRVHHRRFLFTRRDLAEFSERRHFKAKGAYEKA
jgi:excisionase family DNA binding protein